jgi:predicted alpha/beta-fold hydrolase
MTGSSGGSGGGGVTWSIDEYCSTKLNDELLLALNLKNRRSDDTNTNTNPNTDVDDIIRDDDYWSIVLGVGGDNANNDDNNDDNDDDDDDNNNENNRQFLTDLNLPAIHPFCINKSNFIEDSTTIKNNNIPPMGSLDFFHEVFKGISISSATGTGTGTGEGGGESNTTTDLFQAITTLWYLVAPTLLAMGELWLRLFAGMLGPIGIVYLAYTNFNFNFNTTTTKSKLKLKPTTTTSMMTLSFGIILTVSSTLILMTDTLYVLQNGPMYGIILFITSITLSIRLCFNYNLNITSIIVALLFSLSIHLITNESTTTTGGTNTVHFGNTIDNVQINDGLYYNTQNKLVSKIVHNWVQAPEQYHMYGKNHGATTWMPTGDSRTGLPFILNKHHIDDEPNWVRVFLEVNGNDDDDTHDTHDDDDNNKEYLAIDISFPNNSNSNTNSNNNNVGHDWTKPIYFVLHGLHGGTNEEYIRDLTIRRNKEGSTVIVMIARGLMDTPIKGWNVFHGARTSDVHTAAKTIRHNVLEKQKHQNQNQKQQILIGVGYSMGGIIMSNYVASYGTDVQFDAAIAVSGGLDMRYQEHAYRTQRLWQPMLAGTLRNEFLLGKFGNRVKSKLSKYEFLQIMRATHITVSSVVFKFNLCNSM